MMVSDKYDVELVLQSAQQVLREVLLLDADSIKAVCLGAGLLATELEELKINLELAEGVVSDELMEHHDFDVNDEVDALPRDAQEELILSMLKSDDNLIETLDEWNDIFAKAGREYRIADPDDEESMDEDLEDIRQDLSDVNEKVLRLIKGGKK